MIQANRKILPAAALGFASLLASANNDVNAQTYNYPQSQTNLVQIHEAMPLRPAEKPVVMVDNTRVGGFLKRLISRVRPGHRFRKHSSLTEKDAKYNLYHSKKLQPRLAGQRITNTANIQTSLGFIQAKSASVKLPVPHSFSTLYGVNNTQLAQKSWTKFTNLFASEFYSQNFDPNTLSKEIVEAIEPYLKLDSSWGHHPDEIFFAYTSGVKPEELGTVHDLCLKYGLDEKKGSIDHNKTALDYAINRVKQEDIKDGEGIELLVLEAANKRKFISYLKQHAPTLDPKEAFAFAQKYLGVKPISNYEKDVMREAHDFCPVGNLYRVNGKFLARAVLNTMKLQELQEIIDPTEKEQKLSEFYGKAKKHIFMLSGEDHNAVSKSGMGLERFAELDDAGLEKIFVMIPNDEIGYEGESQRPDESILSAMEKLFDCVENPANIFTGFGHGSRYGVCVAPNSSAKQINNPNFLDLADGHLIQAKSCLLAPDAVINWISCSTAKPYTQEEYSSELQDIKPLQRNIALYEKEIKAMQVSNKNYSEELERLKKEKPSDYRERRSLELKGYIEFHEKSIKVAEKSLKFQKEFLRRKSEYIGRVFAHEYTAAINTDSKDGQSPNRSVNAAVVDVKNLPAGPGGYGGTGHEAVILSSK